MNKILLGTDKIENEKIDEAVKIKMLKKQKFIGVCTLKIKVLKSTDLQIEYDSDDIKYDIYVDLDSSVNLNLYEIKRKGSYKISYHYDLKQKSSLNICAVNDAESVKENIIVNLNGEEAKANYLLKTISKMEEKYNVMVYHNAKKTESLIINEGVSIRKGKLIFNVSGFVLKGIKGCTLNQNNRIINLTNEKSQINPNLFIDENDCVANHSAHIGKCNENELFYLMSRGITKETAENLIIRGFLTKNLEFYKKDMVKIIDKYWR